MRQYKKLKEEELQCQLMQQKLQEQRQMLDKMQAPSKVPGQTNP